VSAEPAACSVNQPVIITATGAGSGLSYRFWVNNNSPCSSPNNPSWEMLQDWSSRNVCTWVPPTDGMYTLVVWTADDPTRPCVGMGGMTYRVE
jgi:hypothetical protein